MKIAQEDQDDFNSAVGTGEMLTLTGTYYWYLSKKLALMAQTAYLPYYGSVVSEVESQSGDVSINAQAELDPKKLNEAFALIGAAAFSWGAFNLHAGIGYGNVFLTGLGLVVPARTVYPYLNFYVRL